MEQTTSKSTYFGNLECSEAGKHFATTLVPARKVRRIEFRDPYLETSAPGQERAGRSVSKNSGRVYRAQDIPILVRQAPTAKTVSFSRQSPQVETPSKAVSVRIHKPFVKRHDPAKELQRTTKDIRGAQAQIGHDANTPDRSMVSHCRTTLS